MAQSFTVWSKCPIHHKLALPQQWAIKVLGVSAGMQQAHQGHGGRTGVRSDSAWTGLIMPPFPWLAVHAMWFGGTTISVWMFWEAVPACQNIRRANGKAPLHTHTYTCESSITAACHTWLDTKLMVQQQRDRERSSRKIVFLVRKDEKKLWWRQRRRG